MDVLSLYQDNGVIHLTEGHKHCRPGWVNTPCPFCTGNPGFHLGATFDGAQFYCWRCGWKPPIKAIASVLKISERDARLMVGEYGGVRLIKESITTDVIGKTPYKLPSGLMGITESHKNYLRKRNFDPDKIINKWNLIGAGPVAMLDDGEGRTISYARRIIAPIQWNGQDVSFQGRDITDSHLLKYLACPKSREIIHHKHILYGDQTQWRGVGLIVEGITDVWRLGPIAAATFGIEFTPRQVREIKRHFNKAPVLFDDEPQAIRKANELVKELRFRGVKSWRITIKGDPGAMSQDDADYLVKSIL